MGVRWRYLVLFALCLRAAVAGAAGAGKDAQLEEARRLKAQILELRRTGKFAEAAASAQRQVQLLEAARGAGHPEVAEALNDLASLYMEQGDRKTAEPLLLRALKIFEAAHGPDHPDVAGTLLNLGVMHHFVQPEKAEPLILRALRIFETKLGAERPEVALTLIVLGSVHRFQGAIDKTEQCLLRALRIRETLLGPRHPDLAAVLNDLAAVYQDEGAYDKAEPLYVRALQIYQEAPAQAHAQAVISAANNLGKLYMAQGALGKAEPVLLRALRTYEPVLGKDHYAIAHCLTNLGLVYLEQRAYDKASPLLLRALQAREATLGEKHPDVGLSLITLGRLHLEQGAWAQAEPLLVRGLEIVGATRGKNHPVVVNALYYLGLLYQAQGAPQRAVPHLSRAFLAAEHTLRLLRLHATETRLDAFLKVQQTVADAAYSLPRDLPQDPDAARLALAVALLHKGRSLDETALSSQELFDLQAGQAEPGDDAAYARLQLLRRRLARVYVQGQRLPGPSPAELEQEAEELEQRLARRSLALRQRRQTPGQEEIIPRVSQALPPDGALVELVQYRRRRIDATGRAPLWDEQRYLALALLPGEVIVARDLGPAAAIDQAAAALLQKVADEHAAQAAYLPPAQALYRQVFAPLLPALRGRRQVFLSLDGLLQQVPFAVLHDGGDFLLSRYSFTYLSSGRDLLRGGSPGHQPPTVVVLANPDFAHAGPAAARPPQQLATRGQRAPDLGMMMQRLGPLPGTLREAELIKRRFPQARLLLQGAATEGALLSLRAPDLLHLATHGLFVEDAAAPDSGPGDPRRGGWRVVREVTAPATEDRAVQPVRALSRSALMLAGAKAPRGPERADGEDGLVTALEVAGMDLRGTRLVVLSACDSGRGEVKRGQGLYGFRRAFFLAGAETLVTSLWKVSDQGTAELMDRYYQDLGAGKGRVEAMEEAMKAMRARRPHPYYWAPFIVLGRGAPLR